MRPGVGVERAWRVLIVALLCPLMASAGVAGALDLQGHRGARGLEPENTLEGFARALEIGVTTLELDLGVTRDGVLVVSHDRRLNPEHTLDALGHWLSGTGPAIRELTFAQLRQFDVGRLRPGTAYALRFPHQRARSGARIPAFREVVELTRRARNPSVRFNVETKLDPNHPGEAPEPEAFADLVVAELRGLGLERRATIQSFDWRTLRRVHAVAPEIDTVALTIQSASEDVDDLGGSVPRLVHALGARVWSPHAPNLTPALLREAHDLGLAVIVWTVNEPADLDATMELGVDGIISDYPDRLRAAAARHGQVLPPATPIEP